MLIFVCIEWALCSSGLREAEGVIPHVISIHAIVWLGQVGCACTMVDRVSGSSGRVVFCQAVV